GSVFLPDRELRKGGVVDISDRVESLFGAKPKVSQRDHAGTTSIETLFVDHDGGGRAGFLRADALARALPREFAERPGEMLIEEENGVNRYWFVGPSG